MPSKSKSSTTAMDAHAVSVESGKSKRVLLAITAAGGSAAGLDRLYMGCRATGLLKLALFSAVAGTAAYEWYTNKEANTAAPGSGTGFSSILLRLISFLLIWTVFDSVVVFYNALSGSYKVPYSYCRDKSRVWKSVEDVEQSKILAVIIIVATVVANAFMPTYILDHLGALLGETTEFFTGGFKQL